MASPSLSGAGSTSPCSYCSTSYDGTKPDPKWVDVTSLDKLYAEDDLSSCSLFAGGYINFGYWDPSILSLDSLSLNDRIQSEKNLYKKLLSEVKITSSDAVLEIGCGLGLGSSLIYDEFHPLSMTGMDISDSQVERASKLNIKAIRASAGKLSYIVGNAERMPIASESYDVVCSVEAAQHFPVFSDFILETSRVLKPGGRFALTTFLGTGPDSSRSAALFIPTVADGIDHIIPIQEVRTLLETSGFKNVQIKSIGENVWYGFDKWIAQTEFRDTWDKDWLTVYRNGYVDYYTVTAIKA